MRFSQKADGKDVGEADRAYGGALVRVFYLFYLRLVQFPHQLVRGDPSSRWLAGTDASTSGKIEKAQKVVPTILFVLELIEFLLGMHINMKLWTMN